MELLKFSDRVIFIQICQKSEQHFFSLIVMYLPRAVLVSLLNFRKVNFLAPRSVSQRGVTYFANICAKTNRSAKPFQTV